MKRQCKIHHIELKTSKVEVRFGMPPAPPIGYFEAQENLFPQANSWVMGGCLIDDLSEDTTKVRFCQECRNAEKEWLEGRDVQKFWKP